MEDERKQNNGTLAESYMYPSRNASDFIAGE